MINANLNDLSFLVSHWTFPSTKLQNCKINTIEYVARCEEKECERSTKRKKYIQLKFHSACFYCHSKYCTWHVHTYYIVNRKICFRRWIFMCECAISVCASNFVVKIKCEMELTRWSINKCLIHRYYHYIYAVGTIIYDCWRCTILMCGEVFLCTMLSFTLCLCILVVVVFCS